MLFCHESKCVGAVAFVDEEELRIHLTTEHLSWTPYECFFCKYVRLPTKRALEEHFQFEHPGEKFILKWREDQPKEKRLNQMLQRSVDQSRNNTTDNELDDGSGGSKDSDIELVYAEKSSIPYQRYQMNSYMGQVGSTLAGGYAYGRGASYLGPNRHYNRQYHTGGLSYSPLHHSTPRPSMNYHPQYSEPARYQPRRSWNSGVESTQNNLFDDGTPSGARPMAMSAVRRVGGGGGVSSVRLPGGVVRGRQCRLCGDLVADDERLCVHAQRHLPPRERAPQCVRCDYRGWTLDEHIQQSHASAGIKEILDATKATNEATERVLEQCFADDEDENEEQMNKPLIKKLKLTSYPEQQNSDSFQQPPQEQSLSTSSPLMRGGDEEPEESGVVDDEEHADDGAGSTAQESVVCGICKQKLQYLVGAAAAKARSRTLIKHVKLAHFKGALDRCSACDFEADTPKAVMRHIKAEHSGTDATPIKCSRFQEYQEMLIKARRLSLIETNVVKLVEGQCRLRKCSECDFRIPTEKFLMHVRRAHFSKPFFACTVCKQFSNKRKDTVNRHMSLTHPEIKKPPSPQKLKENAAEFERIYTEFRNSSELYIGSVSEITPEDRKHDRSVPQNYSSDIAKALLKTAKMVKQERSEIGDRMETTAGTERACKICRYVPREGAQRHVVVKHIEGRLFKCTQCEKSAKLRGDMYAHNRKVHMITDPEGQRAMVDLGRGEEIRQMLQQCFGVTAMRRPFVAGPLRAHKTPTLRNTTVQQQEDDDEQGHEESDDDDDDQEEPEEAIIERPNPSKDIQCQECGVYPVQRWDHLYVAHIRQPCVFCPECDFSSVFHVDRVARHIHKKHPKCKKGPIDNKKSLANEAMALTQKCFPV